MATLSPVSEPGGEIEDMRALARSAAHKILARDEHELPKDPRDPIFASEFIRECDRLLAQTPLLLQEAIESAGYAAEGANVDPYQGVVEVLQNADDQSARQVRMMLRQGVTGHQMLMAHDGLPVEYRHVLAMMLPFVSTKRDDADLRGRFGIGLKTLRRICTDIEVHGAPYHFGSGAAVNIVERPPEPAIPEFYSPETDTLLVLDLDQEFDEGSFANWFHDWTDDGLMFLDYVRRFELKNKDGSTSAHETKATDWVKIPERSGELMQLQRRKVTAGGRHYRVYRGFVQVPEGQARFHKRTAAMTPISIATAGVDEKAGIFVGFRTRIPTALPFAIDAQFDPISSREGIQGNKWNEWLLKKVGLVIAHAASRELVDQPKSAWSLVPIASEGVIGEGWPAEAFAEALQDARNEFVKSARFGPAGDRTLSEGAFEDRALSPILNAEDLAEIAPDHWPIDSKLRDQRGRWRTVVESLGVCRRVTPDDLMKGMAAGLFAAKDSGWWVDAAAMLTETCDPLDVFGASIWLCDDGNLAGCAAKDTSDRKLVFGAPLPAFAERYHLFSVLHPAFSSPRGRTAIDWLVQNAAFTAEVDAQDELLAFASAFKNDPKQLTCEELRELRDLLDPFTGTRAQNMGDRLGKAVLIEGVEGTTKGNRSWRSPSQTYLPRAIDKDTPFWPKAAFGIAGIWWAHPYYEDGLRTGLGKRRKRDDGTRSRGARNFLALLGVRSGPRLEHGEYRAEGSDARRESMRRANATRLSADIRSPDIDRVLRVITNRKVQKKERKDRAIALLRSLSRDWSRHLSDHSTVQGEHTARVYTYIRGTHDALWLDRLKETAWIPVGRERFRKPAAAAVRTSETQAIYKSEDLVVGVDVNELDDDFVHSLGLTAHVRASDLLNMLESMRDGERDFDASRVYLAYQHFARLLLPRSAWVSEVDDVPIAEFRQRFAAKEGLVLVDMGDGTADWRRPDQVRRGKAILPENALYVPDREAFRSLWSTLKVGETTIDDCCNYLKAHAEQHDPAAEQGVVIQVYRHLNRLLVDHEGPSACRHIPLACFGIWRARRPIYVIADEHIRDRLAAALPEQHFWQPPCDPRSINSLIEALGVTPLGPVVRPLPDQRAKEQGEDLTPTFRAAVDHLSNSLGKREASLRQALTVSWDALRSATLYVYDGEVPVDVDARPLSKNVRTDLQAYVLTDPLQFHVSSDAVDLREGAGAAIATLFDDSSLFPFDAEWVLAWQAAKRAVADALQFEVDDAAHKAKIEATANEIKNQKGKAAVKLKARKDKKGESLPPSPPARELKDFQPGISSVEIVDGKPPQKPKRPVKTKLGKRTRPSRPDDEASVPNTSYTHGEIEDFGWDVLLHVLNRADGAELEDFRRRHGVGADGAFNWDDFVELKATGRSMQTSVSLTPMEFKRALEKGNDYILALVHNCEKGSSTKVKLIFDPARRVSLRETEGVRLYGLPDAPGIIVELGESGEIKGIES